MEKSVGQSNTWDGLRYLKDFVVCRGILLRYSWFPEGEAY